MSRGVSVLHIHRHAAPITVLGPGNRAVIWTQGCPFTCTDCITPDAQDLKGGAEVTVASLARWVREQHGIEGITISGGEPFLQAGALVRLIDKIRAVADYGVICYTGYVLEDLQQSDNPAHHALLQRIDLLIDGPYLQQHHADLLWRGSANQQLIPLTDRYRAVVDHAVAEVATSAGMQFFLDEVGVPWFAGIPALPSFRQAFESQLRARGVLLSVKRKVQL